MTSQFPTTVIDSIGTTEGILPSSASAAFFNTAFDFDALVTVEADLNSPILLNGATLEAQTKSQLSFSSAAGEELSLQIGQPGEIGLAVIIPYKIVVEPTNIGLIRDNNFVAGSQFDDRLKGLNGDDYIRGNDGGDLITGNRGNDLLSGDSGDDLLRGNSGNDTLNGGLGNDTLNGGRGQDVLTGGDGADIFRGTLAQLDGDRILDLTDRDKVVLRNVSFTRDDVFIALPGLTSGATPFTLWTVDAGEAGSANLTIEGFDAVDFTVVQQGNNTIIEL